MDYKLFNYYYITQFYINYNSYLQNINIIYLLYVTPAHTMWLKPSIKNEKQKPAKSHV